MFKKQFFIVFLISFFSAQQLSAMELAENGTLVALSSSPLGSVGPLLTPKELQEKTELANLRALVSIQTAQMLGLQAVARTSQNAVMEIVEHSQRTMREREAQHQETVQKLRAREEEVRQLQGYGVHKCKQAQERLVQSMPQHLLKFREEWGAPVWGEISPGRHEALKKHVQNLNAVGVDFQEAKLKGPLFAEFFDLIQQTAVASYFNHNPELFKASLAKILAHCYNALAGARPLPLIDRVSFLETELAAYKEKINNAKRGQKTLKDLQDLIARFDKEIAINGFHRGEQSPAKGCGILDGINCGYWDCKESIFHDCVTLKQVLDRAKEKKKKLIMYAFNPPKVVDNKSKC